MKQNRHLISYILFLLGAILLLALGLGRADWTTGVVLALIAAVAGLIFYRRGK